ncbi:hypothetical protein FACS1894204_02330 [Synergistales bacterium]|nr:hypothetical protein FACS1894204_02330 [Synergistales bacterium]
MKRIMIFVVVGLLVFLIGAGGGYYCGRYLIPNDSVASSGGWDASAPQPPGPIVSLGEFTSNLAGSGRHVITFTPSLETLNNQAAETVSGLWLPRVKNAVLLLIKDKVYEDLTSAEGALQFSEDIKRTLNSQLPDIKGEVPVVRVLFESFVLQ